MREDQPGREVMEKYPDIFREMDMSPQESCMYWGLAIGEGWIAEIEPILAIIDRLSKKSGVKFVASQVKEKFGGLRIYFSLEFPEEMEGDDIRCKFFTSHFHNLVAVASVLCAYTCEECGDPGSTEGSKGYIQCLCTKCREDGKERW